MSEHVRDHRSLLAAAEKRLLIAIAQRLPLWIHSDHLTALAMAAMVAAGGGYVLARWDTRALWLVVFALAVNWFGDSLDGTLARVRKVERPKYGFYLDHVLDIVGATVLFGGLAASTYMSPVIALSLLVAYLLVSGEVFLATAVRGVFRMAFGGVGPTELRILLAIGTIALRNDPHVNFGFLGRMPLFDFGGLIAIGGLAFTFLISATQNAVALARLEPRRPPGSPEALRKPGHGSTMAVYESQGIRHSVHSEHGDSDPGSDAEGPKPANCSRGADAQPQERRRDTASRQAGNHHGRQRVGEVLARLRHDLRRGAA
jgi:phosphatidylglycerophosphate synthase